MSSNVTRQPGERPEPQPAQHQRGDGWVVGRFALWAVCLTLMVASLLWRAEAPPPGAGRFPKTDWAAVALYAAVFVPLFCFALWRLLAAFADLTGATSTPRRPGSCP